MSVAIHTVSGMPMFAPGMDVARELAAAMDRQGETLREGDVVVVAQKIVSKAEGRIVALQDVRAGEKARALAAQTGREPEFAQLILDESIEILRAGPAAIIARHRSGQVLANAGIDVSNVEPTARGEVLLWPSDPDQSARSIRADLMRIANLKKLGLIVADSMGRAWRLGTIGHAIGAAGVVVIDDRRNRDADLYGRTLQATIIGVADSIAAAAVLAMGEAAQATPAAVVRGLHAWCLDDDGAGAAAVVRAVKDDMFR